MKPELSRLAVSGAPFRTTHSKEGRIYPLVLDSSIVECFVTGMESSIDEPYLEDEVEFRTVLDTASLRDAISKAARHEKS